MRIRPTHHVLQRMADRGISPAEMSQAFGNRDIEYPGDDGATVSVGSTDAGRRIKIVWRETDNGDILIITVAEPDQ